MNIHTLPLIAIGIFLSACSSIIPKHPEPTKSGNSAAIRVATYNVFTGAHDPASTAKVIRSLDADVVALQELSSEGAMQLNQQLRAEYPHRRFSEGLAILSRHPISNARYEKSQHGINGFLFVVIHSPHGKFQLASLHLDPLHLWTPEDRRSVLWQLIWGQNKIHHKEIEQILKSLNPKLPTILVGDFNSASGSPIQHLKKHGFEDSFAQVHRNPNQAHSLRFKLFGIPLGRRIDFIMHDSSFRTQNSQVHDGSPSDHNPVLSVLEWVTSSMKNNH